MPAPTAAELQALTDTELMDLQTRVAQESLRRTVVAGAQAQQDQIARQYEQAVKDLPVLTSVPQGGVPPGRKIKNAAGVTYVNSSGAWLPVGPDQYAMGYKLDTRPVTATAWAAGQAVKVGDLRLFNSVVYKALQAHTTQAGWEPPNVPALWAPA